REELHEQRGYEYVCERPPVAQNRRPEPAEAEGVAVDPTGPCASLLSAGRSQWAIPENLNQGARLRLVRSALAALALWALPRKAHFGWRAQCGLRPCGEPQYWGADREREEGKIFDDVLEAVGLKTGKIPNEGKENVVHRDKADGRPEISRQSLPHAPDRQKRKQICAARRGAEDDECHQGRRMSSQANDRH